MKPGDPTYLYLELLPLRPKDQAEFDKMTLVLVKPGLPGAPAKQAYLPRMAQLVKPPGRGVETWDFPDVQANPAKKDGTPIGAADFEPLDPGPGWKVVKPAVRGPAER